MFGLGRIQLIIIGGIMLFGVLSGIYYSWRTSIEKEALMQYNQRQLEQSIEDQKKLKAALDDIEKKQADIIKQTEEDKKAYDQKLSVVDTTLDNTKVDRPSSDILKNTVKQLKDISK